MLQLPESPTDEIELADWLELTALVSPDLNSHRSDLYSALNQGSLFDEQGEEVLEAKILDTFDELETRVRSTGAAYPFAIEGGLVQAYSNWRDLSSYVFSLCLSYVRWEQRRGMRTFPARIFEALCTQAAAAWIGGHAVRFGSPRQPPEMPRGFVSAINELSKKHLCEGNGIKKEERVDWTKDYGLDVVAWRYWPDDLAGKLIVFGACASGRDWDEKVRDLDIETFWNQWIEGDMLSPIIRAFFIPHRIPSRRWKRTTREAGIVFDRCRIASLSEQLPSDNPHGDGLAWIDSVLQGLQTE